MPIPVGQHLDLRKHELQNVVAQNLGSAPSSPVEGQFYYNNSTKFILFWNGTAWVIAGTTGGADAGTLNGQAGSYYLNRANHTGTQPVSTLSDFTTAVDSRADARIAAWVGAAPASLDTLQELADALNNDPAQIDTILSSLATKPTKFATDVGDGTSLSLTVTHNLNTKDVIVQVYDKTTPFQTILVDVRRATVNTVTLEFGAPAPTSNQYRCVVHGI